VTSARLPFFSLIFLWIGLMAGCGAKRPVADHRQPVPNINQPDTGSEPSPDAAKSGANNTSPPVNPSTAARPKRSKTPPPPMPAGYTEEGKASWYGEPFNGRRSSNGEIYDMHKLTAAHRTMPFETMVRVTNLNNGKSTTVRITDRGPFVDNRVIDLSLAAARDNNKLATLAQAISKTNPTAPSISKMDGRTVPTICSCKGTRRTP
jgi:rare lipoprotein A